MLFIVVNIRGVGMRNDEHSGNGFFPALAFSLEAFHYTIWLVQDTHSGVHGVLT